MGERTPSGRGEAAVDYDAVASQLNYTHAGGRVARGLERRSERRAAMFAGGRYGNLRDLPHSQRV